MDVCSTEIVCLTLVSLTLAIIGILAFFMSRTYLDHAATTPIIAEARAAMDRGFDAYPGINGLA